MLNDIEESKLFKTKDIYLFNHSRWKNWGYQRKGEELQKVIIHVDTNNTMTDTHKEILEKLISLKHQIENILPKCEVTISNLIMRMDEPKAAKINEVCCLIKVS